ncbi:MAG: DUF4259 domain-containing protein [Candidatus Sericytochromatia bacterium]
MDTWGYGAFENDAGSDLVHDLKQAKGPAILKDAFAGAKSGGWDSDDCQTAVAAAEIIAAMRGAPSPSLPKEAAAWVQKQPQPPAEPLVAQARDVVKAILANSELKEIWQESGSAKPWIEAMQELQRRLNK